MYKIEKQQGPTVQHRELYSMSCNKLNGKESEKEHTHTHIYTMESSCYIPEANTTL